MVMAPSAIHILNESNTISFDHVSDGMARAKTAGYATLHGQEISKELIRNALKKRVLGIDGDICEPGDEDAFFVADMGEVYRQHLRWKMNLKRVRPHYGTVSLFSPGDHG